MVKKATSKKKPARKTSATLKKTKPTEVHYHSTKEIKVEQAIVDNFISLQKVMVNLSAKFDRLSDNISKLLDLFEISAKAMAKKDFSISGDSDTKKILDKLNSISQQAGLIGRGLELIHQINEERQGTNPPPEGASRSPRPMPQSGMQPSIINKSNRPPLPIAPANRSPMKSTNIQPKNTNMGSPGEVDIGGGPEHGTEQ